MNKANSWIIELVGQSEVFLMEEKINSARTEFWTAEKEDLTKINRISLYLAGHRKLRRGRGIVLIMLDTGNMGCTLVWIQEIWVIRCAT